MGVLELFFNNLRNAGVNAALGTGDQSLLSKLNMFGARSMGRIVLQGRQIDEIELSAHYETHDTDTGINTHHSHITAVDIDYVLNGNISGKKQLLKAKLNVKRTGLIRKKVEAMNWQGSTLAEMLNKDTYVNDLLWQSLGQLSARDIEVKPDEDHGKIEIHVRDDRQVFNGNLPPIQLYERIAEYIYAVIGVAKTVAPLNAQPQTSASPPAQAQTPQESPVREETVPAAVPTAPPAVNAPPPQQESGIIAGIKYCFNCGTRMPEDGLFCPKCGTRQD